MSSLSDSVSEFLEYWLSELWLCWGLGPLLAVNCGMYMTVGLLELGMVYDCGRLLSPFISHKIGKEQNRRAALAKESSFQKQLLGALSTTIGPIAILNAALFSVLMSAFAPGPFPLIPSTPWYKSMLQLLAMLVLNDFFMYWGHRVQHESCFLWQFHAVHHSIQTPRPLTTANIHPIDATLQGGLPMILSTIVCRPHPWIVYIFFFVRVSENVVDHCGSNSRWVETLFFKQLPLRAGVDHHDRHHFACNHAKRATNYAESFIIWDWLFGTLAVASTKTQ